MRSFWACIPNDFSDSFMFPVFMKLYIMATIPNNMNRLPVKTNIFETLSQNISSYSRVFIVIGETSANAKDNDNDANTDKTIVMFILRAGIPCILPDVRPIIFIRRTTDHMVTPIDASMTRYIRYIIISIMADNL